MRNFRIDLESVKKKKTHMEIPELKTILSEI